MKKDPREVLEFQAQVLKSILDGMDCFLFWDSLDEKIFIAPKNDSTSGIPILDQD